MKLKKVGTWMSLNLFKQLFVRLAKRYPSICSLSVDETVITVRKTEETVIISRCENVIDAMKPQEDHFVPKFDYYLESKTDNAQSEVAVMISDYCELIEELHI